MIARGVRIDDFGFTRRMRRGSRCCLHQRLRVRGEMPACAANSCFFIDNLFIIIRNEKLGMRNYLLLFIIFNFRVDDSCEFVEVVDWV